MNSLITSHDQATRMMHYDAGKRSTGVAYLLWFFLGLFGAHRFYLQRTPTAALILACTLLGFVTMGITALVSVLICFFDMFTIPSGVGQYNRKLIDRLT